MQLPFILIFPNSHARARNVKAKGKPRRAGHMQQRPDAISGRAAVGVNPMTANWIPIPHHPRAWAQAPVQASLSPSLPRLVL